MTTRVRLRRSALIGALVLCIMVPASAPASARHASAPRITTIADGLNAPLGMAIGRDGIYVVQAFAGAITRVRYDGRTTTVFRQDGVNLNGGIDVDRRGVVFTQTTGEAETAPPNTSSLARLRGGGGATLLAALTQYEQRRNPDRRTTYGFADLPKTCDVSEVEDLPQPQPYTGTVDSNPYAVAAHRGGYLVADAAGNSILRVLVRHGHARIRTVAVLPPVPQTVTAEAAADAGAPDCVVGETYWSEPVPTDVEVGRDGSYYVSSLPGGPELPGTGSVFRIDARRGTVRQVASGFSGAVDLAVGERGEIYVAELSGDRISVIRRGRVRTFAEVKSPGAIEVGRDGRVYAAINVFDGQKPGNGTVVAITPRRRQH